MAKGLPEFVIEPDGKLRIGEKPSMMPVELSKSDSDLLGLWREVASAVYSEDLSGATAVTAWRPSGKREGWLQLSWILRFLKPTVRERKLIQEVVSALQHEGIRVGADQLNKSEFLIEVEPIRSSRAAMASFRAAWALISGSAPLLEALVTDAFEVPNLDH